MNKRPEHILLAALCLLACSSVIVPLVTAANDCDHWRYPYAGYEYEIYESEILPIAVKFNSTSFPTGGPQQIESWRWDFGDGQTLTIPLDEYTPEAVDPIHGFTTYRDHFDVCLKVTTVCTASDEVCKQVEVHCKKPRAGFTVDKTEGVAPMWVHMTDTSQHTPESVTTWVYKKDGTTFSSERSPVFYFTEPGDYTIRQTVKKTCNPDSDTFSQEIHIREPIQVYTVMNLSFPTTTPTIAVVGMYFNLSNTTSAATTPTPTTTTHIAAAATTTMRAAAAATTTTRAAAAATTTAGTVTAAALTTPLSGAPPASGTGTLSVITAPPGAEVYVDDVLRGASPVTVPGLSAGSHSLRLGRDGYQTMVVPIDIIGGKTTDYATSLIPVSGGMGMLPLIGGAVVLLALAAGGAYLYMKQKKAP